MKGMWMWRCKSGLVGQRPCRVQNSCGGKVLGRGSLGEGGEDLAEPGSSWRRPGQALVGAC